MKKKMLLVPVCAMLVFTACRKDETAGVNPAGLSSQKPTRAGTSSEELTSTYYYGENTYEITVKVTYDGDQPIALEPEESREAEDLRNLLSSPTTGLFFESPDRIHIYFSMDEFSDIVHRLDEDLGSPFSRGIDPSYYQCLPYYRMYRHANYVDQMYEGSLYTNTLGVQNSYTPDAFYYGVPWVGSGNNDQISSLRLSGGLFHNIFAGPPQHTQYLVLYEHINYGGRSLALSSKGCNPLNVPNLKTYWIWQFLFFGENWNDRTSSFKAHYWIQ